MTVNIIAAMMPALILFYIMICRLNGRKWRATTTEPWGYLLLLGGAVYTIATAVAGHQMPTLGKFLMDAGACLYFTQHSLRINRSKGRRS